MANDQRAVVALKGIAAQRRSYRVEFTKIKDQIVAK